MINGFDSHSAVLVTPSCSSVCPRFTPRLHSPRDGVGSPAEHTGSRGPEDDPGSRPPLVVEGSRHAYPVPALPGGRPGALGAY
jgi:hypothetical protein